MRKKICVTVLLMIMLRFYVTAQLAHQTIPENHPFAPDKIQTLELASKLSAKLSLNDAQKVTIEQLFMEHFSQVNYQLKSFRATREKEHQAMDSLRIAFELKIVGNLTDKQKEGYFVLLQKQHSEHLHKRNIPLQR